MYVCTLGVIVSGLTDRRVCAFGPVNHYRHHSVDLYVHWVAYFFSNGVPVDSGRRELDIKRWKCGEPYMVGSSHSSYATLASIYTSKSSAQATSASPLPVTDLRHPDIV